MASGLYGARADTNRPYQLIPKRLGLSIVLEGTLAVLRGLDGQPHFHKGARDVVWYAVRAPHPVAISTEAITMFRPSRFVFIPTATPYTAPGRIWIDCIS